MSNVPTPGGAPVQMEAMFALTMYGATMLSVQAFERSLAALTLALGAKPWKTKPFKSPEHMHRYLGRLFSRIAHAFQKASAAELRKMLPAGLDPDLVAEIDGLIKWRGRLAHRYLIEKMVLGAGGLSFKPGVPVELLRVSQQFAATGKKVTDLLQSTIASWPQLEDTPPEVIAMFSSFARPLMFGEPWEPPAEQS
ncbi:MAG TPA: hypothetical protein VGX69_05940 [Solirubrobacteraceae bacterium]|jgi:hypothetical protein|nr:hypothetical protein [Solirubrobacteraceae bacterium]